nr:MAG TPA: hypothetical protein [Caudoviricetes sp.]
MTGKAFQFKVSGVKADRRIGAVAICQPDFVMHNLSRLNAAHLAQPAVNSLSLFDVCQPCPSPRLCFIKRLPRHAHPPTCRFLLCQPKKEIKKECSPSVTFFHNIILAHFILSVNALNEISKNYHIKFCRSCRCTDCTDCTVCTVVSVKGLYLPYIYILFPIYTIYQSYYTTLLFLLCRLCSLFI